MNQKCQEELTTLYNFIKDPDLPLLESKLQEFNIFSILNLNRQEIRHSAMLAWLLNPQANHGLGIAPLKILLLQLVDSLSENDRINALLTISTLDSSDVDVTTESDTKTGRIDILIEMDSFVIGIENKIDTKDARGQLSKYATYMKQQFPNKLSCLIYLTPEGAAPQELEDEVIPLSYMNIDALIEHLLISIPQMPSPVHSLLLQYQQLIQREITMEDKSIRELCSQLYKAHKKAIETILEYKMDVQAIISNILSERLEKEEIQIYRASKCFFNFSPRLWESHSCAKVSKGAWLPNCENLMLFEIVNDDKGVVVKLVVGPIGNRKECEKIKQELLEKFARNFKLKRIGKKWTTICSNKLLEYEKCEDATNEEIENKFKNNLDKWLNNEYPKLVTQIEEILQQLQQDYERENAQ